jgi:acyl-CoA thioester hydrolase
MQRHEVPSLNDQPSPRAARTVPHLVDFPMRVGEVIRYADLDPQGHVNNAVFATFFETGRVTLFRDPKNALLVPGCNFVLARSEIDFLRELHWPGAVEIGTRIAAIGRSSYTVAQAIFNGDACAATGRATIVLIDEATRRSHPLPEHAVARLTELMGPQI